MSKLPHNSLWARATTSASTSSRPLSLLSKSHHQYQSQRTTASSPPTSNSSAYITQTSDAAINIAGAVSAPFYGPQPAGVMEAMDGLPGETSSIYFINNSTLASSIQSSLYLSAPMLRNVGSGFPVNPSSIRPQRPLHLWSHLPASVDASFTAKIPVSSRKKGRKLLFDASESVPAAEVIDADAITPSMSDARDDLMASLLAGMSESTRHDSSSSLAGQTGSAHSRSHSALTSTSRTSTLQVEDGSTLFTSTSSTSPTPPRTPSPSPRHSKPLDKDVRFGDVKEPPAKLATTTSSEPSLSSTTPAGEGSQISSSVASTSTAAAASSLSSPQSAPPSQPQAALDGHWAKAFNVPRSNKRHDFMLEHGAYGIPKRHPLSSIRSSGGTSASAKGKGKEVDGERRQDPVTTSRVQVAAGMLSAAADFLAGPQTGSSKEHRPMKGEEALNVAFSGGSTADGQEVRKYTSYSKVQDALPQSQLQEQQQQQSGPSKMVIRGEDGRIIKDRLRSVQVGEDAYFLRPDSLGVADGVGGWTSRPGADPALFSRLLMHFCAVELSRYDNLSATDLAADNGSLLNAWAAVDPVEVMHRAWERCVRASRREGILGSSTALLALLRGDELRIANMGDCVLMIIRGGEMLFRSTEQQHSFNFPVQLGMMGDTAETVKKRTEAANKAKAAGEGEVKSEHMEDYDDVEDVPKTQVKDRKSFDEIIDGTDRSNVNEDEGPEWDEPRRDAGRWSVRVQANDIIVVGSDGLMDNLFDEDIIEEIIRFLPYNGQQQEGEQMATFDPSTFSPQLVSEALCSRAKAVSEDSRAVSSPFQQRAMEEGLHYVGGKHDDISVLVCLVGEREGIDSNATNNSEGAEATPSNTATTSKFLSH
jgi:serine/threonine protein phosphatase PrpC